MTPEEIQQVVEDYRKSSQSLNEFVKKDKDGNIKINLGKLRNFGRHPLDVKDNKDNKEKNNKGAQDTQGGSTGSQGTQGGTTDAQGTQVKPGGAQGSQVKPDGAEKNINIGTQQGAQGGLTGAQGVGGSTGTQSKSDSSQENKVKKQGPDLDTISKYTSNTDISMKDFESPKKEVKPKISPAKFSTSQRQTKGLVKSGELKDTDLNKFKRSNVYTADDGKTQVKRSTIFTKAAFDFGNVKKGQPLGVLTGSQRKKYDLQVANMNNKTKVEAYDLVLDYVLSEGHADSLDEAHYVMMQMDANTIQQIIEMSSP